MAESPSLFSVTSLAEGVRSGQVTSRSVTELVLARIAERDPAIGAFQVVRGQKALDEADAVDARVDRKDLPLAGVPIAVKDNIPVAGEPMRVGTDGSDPSPQSADHPVVARLRAAGGVVVGLTRVPELCVYGVTESVFGATRNPWDLSRTPGGSSGGSAAAVAAGMVPAAHGNDGLGSIRIPAACCGLVGIKPGAGVVPPPGNGAWFGLSENGPLTTTVADSALLLSIMAATPELADAAARPPGRLRIALAVRAPLPGTPVEQGFIRATQLTGEVLRKAGHLVVERELRVPPAAVFAGIAIWCAGSEVDARLLKDRSRLGKAVSRHARAGRVVLRAGLVRKSHRDAWRCAAERFFEDVDVLLTPGLAQLPLPAVPWRERGWLSNLRASSSYAPFAGAWNLAGWPAMVLPAGRHAGSGMPLSVQLVAPPGGEARLLAVAAQLERLAPWPRVAPGYQSPEPRRASQ
jgi:amidase